MSKLILDAQARQKTGRKVRQLRHEGLVPVVIYGKEQDPENAKVDESDFEKVLKSGGTSQLVEVNLEGAGVRNVLIREVQRHPVRHSILHADFYAVSMREKQRVSIPVHAAGHPIGQSVEVVLVQSMDSVEIEALPADIPANIEVDITRLESTEDEPITVAELPDLEGVTYITPMDETIFSLVLTRVDVEEEEEEEELLTAEVPTEPELIGREDEEIEEEDFEPAEEE